MQSARTDHAVYFTLKSRNSKIGPIPVSTTSNETCPPSCALFDACYAKGGPLWILWAAVSKHAPGASWTNSLGHKLTSLTWDAYCEAIRLLPAGQAWRHNQAGDLPGVGDRIDAAKLRQLAKANRGRRGFTYTHKPVLNNPANAAAIAEANAEGFTVNVSANHVNDVDALVALDIGPVVCVLPSTVHGKQDISTEGGTRIVVCPATYIESVRCVDCMLCEKRDRTCAVGFPAHGARKRAASALSQ